MFAFHPMALLLKNEGYPSAIVGATLIHGLLLYTILDNPLIRNDLIDLEQPVYINASTVEDNPQRLRRIEQVEQERAREAAAQQQREQETAAQRAREEAARQEAAQREQQQLEQQRQERETARRRQEEADRQAQQQEAERQSRLEQERLNRQQQEQLAREQESARQAEQERQQQVASQQAASDARAVDTYYAIIHNAVTRNWVVPPSARNGMTAVLSIRLVPTGEIISVDIRQSSGDAAFDRSVEQAVRRAQSFPELQGMSISLFEAQFRNLTLTFRPEDLLR